MIHIPANITQLTYSDILCNKAKSPFACKNRLSISFAGCGNRRSDSVSKIPRSSSCPFLACPLLSIQSLILSRTSCSLKRKCFLPCSPPLSSSTVAPSGLHPPISVELLPLSPACIKVSNGVFVPVNVPLCRYLGPVGDSVALGAG